MLLSLRTYPNKKLTVVSDQVSLCFVVIQHQSRHVRIMLKGHLEESWHSGTMFLIVIQMEASKMFSATLTLVTAGV